MENKFGRPGEATCMDCEQPIGWVLTNDGFVHRIAYLVRDGRTRHPRVVCESCAELASH
jgi:hypothetical protein